MMDTRCLWVLEALPSLLLKAGIAHGEEYAIRHYDLSMFADFATKRLELTARIPLHNPGLRQEFGPNDRDEWLDREGVPEIHFTSSVKRRGDRYRVSGSLRQIGPVYHPPLKIGITFSSGVRLERVDLTGAGTSYSLEVNERPTEVLLDPRGWLLMKRL